MFHIVVFDDTNEVEVVLSLWIKDVECMWPPNKIDAAKAVKSQECPGDEWKPHKMTTMLLGLNYLKLSITLTLEDDDEMECTLNETHLKKGRASLPNAPKIHRKHNTPVLDPESRPPPKCPQEPHLHPSVHRSPDLHPSVHRSPDLHPSVHRSPDLHPSVHNSPDLHPSGYSTPDLHPSVHINPDLHPSGHSSPDLHPSGHSSPDLHPSGHSSPGVHPNAHSSPDLHPSAHSSPDLHPSAHSSPDLHPSAHSSPDLHPSGHSISGFRPSGNGSAEIRTPRHASSEIRTPSHATAKIRIPRHRNAEISTPRHGSAEIRTPRHGNAEIRTPRHGNAEIRTQRHISAEISTPRTAALRKGKAMHGSAEIRTPRHSSAEIRTQSRTAPTVLPSRHLEPHQTREQTSSPTSLLRNILTKQEMIMDQLRIIFKTLKGMKSTDEAEIGLDQTLLPLKDVISLQNMEEQLQSSPYFRKKLVNTLALKGGTDARECVWRIMHTLITNSFAKNINMKGVNGKIGFQRLQIRNVVIDTVRCNRLTSGATDKEVEGNIKRCLHLAPDRDGGRRERMRRKERMDSATS
ncbi:hypothetical protein E1301_Tti020360 [Triplophysa tibetana]|uniref:DUF4806 domain-containing protein n=1 Tax=Triplophysa tibetana TaxID=1572043 RepID=A0A5A9P266_9TELE|nr:hypothetical protein E1301_Tti020360 [Triplophysa tibetana]